jgi:hypothetical protein
MRIRAVLWRVAVLVGWFLALVALVFLDPDRGLWYIGVGAPLTVMVGAVLDRWWVVLVPLLVTLAVGGIDLALATDCRDCSNDEDLRNLTLLLGLIFFAAPATAALATGVGARRLTRFFRGLDDGASPEPT